MSSDHSNCNISFRCHQISKVHLELWARPLLDLSNTQERQTGWNEFCHGLYYLRLGIRRFKFAKLAILPVFPAPGRRHGHASLKNSALNQPGSSGTLVGAKAVHQLPYSEALVLYEAPPAFGGWITAVMVISDININHCRERTQQSHIPPQFWVHFLKSHKKL